MSRRTSTAVFIVVAIILIAIITLAAGSTTEAPAPAPADASADVAAAPATQASPDAVPPIPKSYTMTQVGAHNNAGSCWTAVSGSVYDVTAWIDSHPGGKEAILKLCGKDGTAAFTGQHGGQENPAKALATFKIGSLAQ